MRLENKVALVGGGTSALGEGIVKILMEEGATVFVPCANQGSSVLLQEDLLDIKSGQLIMLKANMCDRIDADRIKNEILAQVGKIDIIVDGLEQWFHGYSLEEMTLEDWDEVVEKNLGCHFVLQNIFMPVLKSQDYGSYVLLQRNIEDIPEDAHMMTVMAAAKTQLINILQKENTHNSVKIDFAIAPNTIGISDEEMAKISQRLGEHIIQLYLEEATEKTLLSK